MKSVADIVKVDVKNISGEMKPKDKPEPSGRGHLVLQSSGEAAGRRSRHIFAGSNTPVPITHSTPVGMWSRALDRQTPLVSIIQPFGQSPMTGQTLMLSTWARFRLFVTRAHYTPSVEPHSMHRPLSPALNKLENVALLHSHYTITIFTCIWES